MEIKFQPFTEKQQNLIEPEPAINHLPDWYKKLPSRIGGKKKDSFTPKGEKGITAKRCNPVGDALGAGYFIFLEYSLSVRNNPETGKTEINWLWGGEDFISSHDNSQINPQMIPNNYYPKVFKFANFWSIQTPKNYSSLITHPFNRTDLPFQTMTGIVDTDTFYSAVQIVFFLQKGFEGVIEAGTPIAQVLPFRRERWNPFYKSFDKNFILDENNRFDKWPVRLYKKFHWVKKVWK